MLTYANLFNHFKLVHNAVSPTICWITAMLAPPWEMATISTTVTFIHFFHFLYYFLIELGVGSDFLLQFEVRLNNYLSIFEALFT